MENMYFKNDAELRKYKTLKVIKYIFIYIFLAIFALFTLLPFYWMIATSLKTTGELDFIPQNTSETLTTLYPQFKNGWQNSYTQIFTNDRYSILFRFMLNTIIVGVMTTLISVCITILAAFAFARLSFKGRDKLFTVLLSTMMIPGEMMIITNFTTVSKLGWINPNSYTAMIIPFTASVFYTFFLMQNFKQIPNELYYAAKVDGNNDFQYLFKVMIPIARPSIITITILSMIGSWNAYIWPRTVASGNMRLVTDGIMSLFSSENGASTENQIMAAATLISLPLLLAFIIFRKYIMRGVSRSGIKG